MALSISYFILISFCSTYIYAKDWQRIPVYLNSLTPDGLTINEGSSVTVYCGSTSPVNWNFVPLLEDGSISETLPISTRHLIGYKNISLLNLDFSESGMYTCDGMYGNNVFQQSLFIFARLFPDIGQVLPNWKEAPLGSVVSLICGTTKQPEWFSLNLRNQSYRTALKQSKLILSNLQAENSGPYVCRGFRYDWKVFHSTALVIVDGYVDRILTTEPEEQ